MFQRGEGFQPEYKNLGKYFCFLLNIFLKLRGGIDLIQKVFDSLGIVLSYFKYFEGDFFRCFFFFKNMLNMHGHIYT